MDGTARTSGRLGGAFSLGGHARSPEIGKRSIQTAAPTAGTSLAAPETARQAVVASAADRRLGVRAGRVDRLEDEAGVIVEIAHEGRREDELLDPQAARGQEAGALIERIERLGQIEAGVRRQLPELSRGRVGIAGNGEKAPQNVLLLGADIGLRARRGLFEEAIGDFAGAAAADRRDAGDGEQIFDERLGAGVVGALERRQNAGLSERAPAVAVHDRLQRAPARQAAPHPAQPDVRQGERGERAVEQARVAEAHLQRSGPRQFGRLQRQRENLGVGGLDVLAAVAFEPGLGHLAALPGAGAKDRAEIGVLRRTARLRPRPR